MPKKRVDLEIPAFRIMEAIRENDFSVRPPHLRVDYVPLFGRQVLEIHQSFRIRLPYRTTKLKSRKPSGQNQMTIPACYLVLRWKPLTEKSPLWYLVEDAKINVYRRHEVGLYYDAEIREWYLLTYQLVEDMSHLLRHFVHIFANYQKELAEQGSFQSQIERQVIDQFVFGTALSPTARQVLTYFQRWLSRREIDVSHITGVIAGRNALAHYWAQRQINTLYAVARDLETSAVNLARLHPQSWSGFQIHLERESAKLDQIGSRNLRFLRQRAQREITAAIWVMRENQNQAQVHLRKAAQSLRKAAHRLESWADTISQEEMTAANHYRGIAS